MFVWRADTMLGEIRALLPEAAPGLAQIADSWGTPRQTEVLNEVYPKLPKISVDYAIMEPASHGKGDAQVVAVEMPVQWLDIGSWPALAETLHTDEHDNAIDAKACVFIDSDGNIVVSNDPEHLVTMIGVSDMIIVHTKDATLVCPKRDAQRVKELVARVKVQFGEKYL
jgi:mannose-1-phosphate guanylyltransferase